MENSVLESVNEAAIPVARDIQESRMLNSGLVAANDNFDLDALADYAEAAMAKYGDDCSSCEPLYVRFSDADAKKLGFESNRVSMDYVNYLLDGHVAEADQLAADLLEEMVGHYAR